MSLATVKKGDKVILRLFTGAFSGVKEVEKADKSSIYFTTGKGMSKFSKKTGKMVEPAPKSERYASFIEEYDEAAVKAAEKARKKGSKKAAKTRAAKAAEEEVDVEEPDEEIEDMEEDEAVDPVEEDEDDMEEEEKPAKKPVSKKKKVIKKAKKHSDPVEEVE